MADKNVVPPEIRERLKDTLTERGMLQWWQARLRYLDERPYEVWETQRDKVIEAAYAWGEGYYL